MWKLYPQVKTNNNQCSHVCVLALIIRVLMKGFCTVSIFSRVDHGEEGI